MSSPIHSSFYLLFDLSLHPSNDLLFYPSSILRSICLSFCCSICRTTVFIRSFIHSKIWHRSLFRLLDEMIDNMANRQLSGYADVTMSLNNHRLYIITCNVITFSNSSKQLQMVIKEGFVESENYWLKHVNESWNENLWSGWVCSVVLKPAFHG